MLEGFSMNILEARAASKNYVVDGLDLAAVRATDLAVVAGEIVGICGASGSGKSTLLRLLGALERPDGGEILIGGEPAWVRRVRGPRRQTPRPGYVMAVFQDPQASLDPRWPLWRSISEPLTATAFRHRPSAAERRRTVARSLAEVGLEQVDPCCTPNELSVGQCQRASLLRALVAEPAAVLADEPTSALDVTTAAGVLQLLRSIADRGTALVVVSHDEAMLQVLADRMLRMRDGLLAPGQVPSPVGDLPAGRPT